MKKIQITPVFIGILILFFMVACNPFDRSGRSILNYAFSSHNSRMIINSNDMSLEINYSGDIVFNDEETAIEKISPGGYLDYRKNGKRLYVEPKAGGDVVYEFHNDNKQSTDDDNGRTFLVEAIHEMISQGMFINGRMERLYQEGGIPLLLAEVKRTKADHVKRMYLEYMLQIDTISQDEMTGISNTIAKMNVSDDDKKRILEKVPANYLNDSSTAKAYFAAIETINSDNDKANVLKNNMKKPLPGKGFDLLLKVALTINSDNDKANLLRDLIRSGTISEESYDHLLDVVNSINADNDKAKVLNTLVEKQIYSGEPFERLLDVIGKINADNDKSNVFRKLVAQQINSDDQWVALINKTESISSDNDKANVLTEISKKMPRSENVIAAYMKTCKTLNADNDYKRAVKPIQ